MELAILKSLNKSCDDNVVFRRMVETNQTQMFKIPVGHESDSEIIKYLTCLISISGVCAIILTTCLYSGNSSSVRIKND